MQIPRVEMPELPATYRAHSLREEVNQGLNKEQAQKKQHAVWTAQIPVVLKDVPLA